MKTTLKKTLLSCVLFSVASIGNTQDTASIWDGIYSAEQAGRGEAVYTETCIACHGQDLGGNSNAPGLTGMGFMFLWDGRSVGELLEKIRSAMATDRPGQLPQQDYLDVVAYILQKNTFPAGAAELPTALDALNAIGIMAQR